MHDQVQTDSTTVPRNRGRNGCLNCRRRRKKCDEQKPTCGKCSAVREVCEVDDRIIFRSIGLEPCPYSTGRITARRVYGDPEIRSINSNRPAIVSQPKRRRLHNNEPRDRPHPMHGQAEYDSLDGYSPNDDSSLDVDASTSVTSDIASITSCPNAAIPDHAYRRHNGDRSHRFLTQSTGQCTDDGASFPQSFRGDIYDTHAGMYTDTPIQPSGQISTAGDIARISSHHSEMIICPAMHRISHSESSTKPRNHSTAIPTELEGLDDAMYPSDHPNYLASMDVQLPPLQYSNSHTSTHDETMSMNVDQYNDFDYSSATYQDLHATLYRHMVETAQNSLTRQASPEPQVPPVVSAVNAPSAIHDAIVAPPIVSPRAVIGELAPYGQPLKQLKMTQRRQLELWRNYLDEVAVWLDMFDNDRHFQFSIPLHAKSADHLHYAILALSARQLERKSCDDSNTESLGLYQEAIKLIVKELYTLDTTVIASCVLLCVLEMMSSSPRAWCRHLDGCARLLEAAGVNGVGGGIGQSVFWCFARMDVWGGYLEDTLTKIPTSRWYIPSGSMEDVVTLFKADSGYHSYANYAVFLCASVVNVISAQADHGDSLQQNFLARWKALFDLLEEWYTNRPASMQPLMSYPSNPQDIREPFPIVLYSGAPAVNGNELYHAATLLMLQHKPRGIQLPKTSKSILWHARQICGIAASNSDHGASINSLQPLWIAGKIMSHETEHQAILSILSRIECDTGWATAWRADDLRDYWG